MRYTIEITMRNQKSAPFKVQIGEITAGNPSASYCRAARLANARIEHLPHAEILSGRIVSDTGSEVALMRPDTPRSVSATSWLTVR